MASVKGVKEHVARLNRLSGPEMRSEAYKALYVAADEMRVDAVHSITDGAVSGIGHVPSQPGSPPKADTHQLDTSIVVEGHPDQLRASVIAAAPHAVPLEWGTSKMAERPFMRPAAKRSRPRVVQLVAAAMKALSRGSK